MGDEYEYVDEQGNPLTPEEVAELLADDAEIVEEVVEEPDVPAATAPAGRAATVAPANGVRVPKALLGGVAALVLVVGGGAVYVLHGIGEQNTVEDVLAGVSSRKAAISSAIESKVEEVKESRTGRKIVGSACRDTEIAGAQWDGDREHMPRHQLRKVGGTSLPGGIRAGLKAKAKGEPRELAMLSPSSDRMGVYVSGPTAEVGNGRGTWQKALISVVAPANPAVLGEGTTVGGDRDRMGACETKQVGTYLVLDAGNDDAPTTIEVLKQLRAQTPNIYGVIGEELVVMELEETEDAVEGGGAPASPSPSK